MQLINLVRNIHPLFLPNWWPLIETVATKYQQTSIESWCQDSGEFFFKLCISSLFICLIVPRGVINHSMYCLSQFHLFQLILYWICKDLLNTQILCTCALICICGGSYSYLSTIWIADLFNWLGILWKFPVFCMFGALFGLLLYILELFGTKEENWVQTKTQAKTQATGELFNQAKLPQLNLWAMNSEQCSSAALPSDYITG